LPDKKFKSFIGLRGLRGSVQLFKPLERFKNLLNSPDMQELINKLKTEAGLTDDQAKKAIEAIKNFVVEKYPMLEGAVNNVFAGD
jgi:hypothetical protein